MRLQQFAQKAFVVHNGALLMVRKSSGDPHNPGRWEVPGGRMSFGEAELAFLRHDSPAQVYQALMSQRARSGELSQEELAEELGSIDKKALDAELKRLGKTLDRPRVALLKAELEAHADKTHSPRFWAKEVQ